VYVSADEAVVTISSHFLKEGRGGGDRLSSFKSSPLVGRGSLFGVKLEETPAFF